MLEMDRYNTPLGYNGGYFKAISDIKEIIYDNKTIIPFDQNTLTISKSAEDILSDIISFIKNKGGRIKMKNYEDEEKLLKELLDTWNIDVKDYQFQYLCNCTNILEAIRSLKVRLLEAEERVEQWEKEDKIKKICDIAEIKNIGDLSDGYHTFNQLYYQRMILFATIVNMNKDKSWKSLRHEDGELCFGGGWFIVGIDTPEGSYTYHYEDKYFSLFNCTELKCGKHWDGHTEKDVVRLLSLA